MSQKTTEKLKEAIAKRDEPVDGIQVTLDRQKVEIARALPNNIDPDRFRRIVLTSVKATPKLRECTATSVVAGAMLAAQLGLEPGPLGLSYLVPYWNKNIKKSEAQFQLGYRGVIELARRSGDLKDIEARTVFVGDEFDQCYGLEPRLVHKPDWEQQIQPRLYYMIARFRSGGLYTRVATPRQIEEHRQRSKASESGPWQTDYEAMAWKTLVQMSKQWLPLSVEAAQGMVLDGAVTNEIAPNMAESLSMQQRDFIDVESEEATPQQQPAEPETSAQSATNEASEQPNEENDPGRPFE